MTWFCLVLFWNKLEVYLAEVMTSLIIVFPHVHDWCTPIAGHSVWSHCLIHLSWTLITIHRYKTNDLLFQVKPGGKSLVHICHCTALSDVWGSASSPLTVMYMARRPSLIFSDTLWNIYIPSPALVICIVDILKFRISTMHITESEPSYLSKHYLHLQTLPLL